MDSNKYVYIVLTQTGTIPSKIIKLFTHQPYNHSSIALDSDLEAMYSFCRKNTSRPLPAGFKHEDIENGIFTLFKEIPCQVYQIPVDEGQYNLFCNIISSFKKNERKYSYNLLGIILILFNIPFLRSRKFVCSQFVAYILQESGIVTFNKHISLIKPDDFRYIENAKLVYSGDIKNYRKNKKSILSEAI